MSVDISSEAGVLRAAPAPADTAAPDEALPFAAQVRRQWRGFRSALAGQPAAAVGFFLFWLWVWIALQSPTLVGTAESPFGAALPSWFVPLIGYAVSFFCVGALHRLRRPVPKGRRRLAVVACAVALCATLQTAVLASPLGDTGAGAAVALACSLGVGAATALLHVEWGRYMSWLGSHATICHCVVALAASTPLVALLQYARVPALLFALPLVAVASCALLARCYKAHPKALQGHARTVSRTPVRFVVTSFVQGLSFGALLTYGSVSAAYQADGLVHAAGMVAGALVMLAVVLFFTLDFNHLIYHLGFVLMACGYFLVGLPGAAALGEFVQSVGYRIVDILMWALCAYLVKQRGLHVDYVFSWTGTMVVGQIAGALAGRLVLGGEPAGLSAPGFETGVFASAMILILLASALFLFDARNLKTGWGMAIPNDEEGEPSPFELGCSSYCADHNLTRRETEIFMLLAQGRNRTYICETLGLARETVKTHVRNIYHKLGIHSHQELITVANEQTDLFS